MANKIYTRTGFQVKSEFKKITANNFRSEAQSLDFSQADAASKVINAWCEAQTNNRIKNIIKPGESYVWFSLLMFVINLIRHNNLTLYSHSDQDL